MPEESLATFPVEFREGMAARAEILGDADESAPEHLEAPIAEVRHMETPDKMDSPREFGLADRWWHGLLRYRL